MSQAKEESVTNPFGGRTHVTDPSRDYLEGFETSVPPAGWTLISTPNHTQVNFMTWYQYNYDPYDGFWYADVLGDHPTDGSPYTAQDEWMTFNYAITATENHINFAAYASYYWMVTPYPNCDLQVCVNGTPLWHMNLETFASWEWNIYDVDLSAYIGQTVEIGLRYVGNWGAEVGLDDVGINAGYVPPPPPPGDTCADALLLPCGAFSVTGTTTGANNNYDPGGSTTCTGYYETGPDVVYYTDLPVGGVFNVTMSTGGMWDDAIYLVTDCANVVASCVAGADLYPDGSTFTYTVPTAGRYYLIVDGWGGGYGAYTITGTNPCVPPTAVQPTTWGSLKGMYR